MLHVHFALALRQMSTFHCRPKKKVCYVFFFVFAGGTLSFVLALYPNLFACFAWLLQGCFCSAS